MGGKCRKRPVSNGDPGAANNEEKPNQRSHRQCRSEGWGEQAAGLRPVTRGPPYRGRGNPEVIPLPSPRQPTLLRGDKHPLLRTMVLKALTCRK